MKRTILIGSSLVLALTFGIAGGAAIALVPAIVSPAGINPGKGIETVEQQAPKYPTSASGETYGSADVAISPESEPDLIQAIASNGKEGYVRKSELDEANGTTAAKSFKSPDDAIKWQESVGGEDRTINVYTRDGKTVIGSFTVLGSKAQDKPAQGLAD